MRTSTLIAYITFILFSFFAIASALPEPVGVVVARADDEFNNPPDPDVTDQWPESNDALATVDADEGTGDDERGGHWGCPKYWGQCRGTRHCCPLGGQCCSNKRCCQKGYYCFKDKWGQNKCCKRGYSCWKRGGHHGHN